MKINRLLANLPFNPSLIGQVSFYARRLHQEEAIRRIGLIMTVLAMMVQMFAIMAPAQPAAAHANENDLIFGGGDKQSILNAYRNGGDGLGRRDIKAIYDHYLGSAGAAEQAIQNGVEETITSDSQQNLWSVGRSIRDGGDVQMSINGSQTSIYQRTLSGWGHGKSWKAYRVKSSVDGQDMWIMKDCGNIVTHGPYQPNPPAPHLNKTAEPAAGSFVKPGDKITYTLLFGNTGPGNMVGTVLYDRVPGHTTLVSGSGNGPNLDNKVVRDDIPGEVVTWWPKHNADKVWSVDKNNHPASFSVIVDKNAPDGTRICNKDANINWKFKDKSEVKRLNYEICHTVMRERCPDGSVKPGSGACQVTCPDGKTKVVEGDLGSCPQPVQAASCDLFEEIPPAADQADRTNRQFKAGARLTNGAKVAEYRFDYDNDGTTDAVIPAGGNSDVYFNFTFPESGGNYQSRMDIRAVVNGKTITTEQPCLIAMQIPEPPNTPDQPLITISKRVRNLTQGLEDANHSTARPGDELEYWMVTKNMGSTVAKEHYFKEEDMNDVLEYADILTLGDGVMNTQSRIVNWAVADIQPGQEVNKKITVHIKEPIPVTPESRTTPQSYDLIMQNSYGSEIIVRLPTPGPKHIESVGKSLPNTGPGFGMVLTFTLVTIVGYFFMRSRILAKELDFVKVEYTSGGF